MADFIKLSSLIDDTFTVESVGGAKYVAWDDLNKKFLMAHEPTKGYQKKYPVTTDKGIIDLGQGQMGNLYEGVSNNGTASIIGKTFKVKSNGETGLNIRYYLNYLPNADGVDQTPSYDGGY